MLGFRGEGEVPLNKAGHRLRQELVHAHGMHAAGMQRAAHCARGIHRGL